MPTGVYKRSKRLRKRIRECLALGRSPAARAKAADKLRVRAKDPEWRERVRQGTLRAMTPEVRAKHARAMQKAHKGRRIAGGNGREPTPLVQFAAALLGPLGFAPEFVVRTAGHDTDHRAPTCYKVDFGSPIAMIAIELDGPAHLGRKREEQDRKKTEVLEALGWRVLRVKHK